METKQARSCESAMGGCAQLKVKTFDTLISAYHLRPNRPFTETRSVASGCSCSAATEPTLAL
jgi:hypothetical protein